MIEPQLLLQTVSDVPYMRQGEDFVHPAACVESEEEVDVAGVELIHSNKQE